MGVNSSVPRAHAARSRCPATLSPCWPQRRLRATISGVQPSAFGELMSAPWSSRYCTMRFEPIMAAPCSAVLPPHRISPRLRWGSSSSRLSGCRSSSVRPSPSERCLPEIGHRMDCRCRARPSAVSLRVECAPVCRSAGRGLSPSQKPTPAAAIKGVTRWLVGVHGFAPCSTRSRIRIDIGMFGGEVERGGADKAHEVTTDRDAGRRLDDPEVDLERNFLPLDTDIRVRPQCRAWLGPGRGCQGCRSVEGGAQTRGVASRPARARRSPAGPARFGLAP